MLSIGEIRARKTGRTVELPIVLDAEWGARLSELESRATHLKFSDAKEADSINEEIGKLRAEYDDKVVVFKLKAISPDRYERIVRAHPSTRDQRTAAKERGEQPTAWNENTFPQALVAACSVDPVMTEDEARDLWADDSWNLADLVDLFQAALNVCLSRHTVARLDGGA